MFDLRAIKSNLKFSGVFVALVYVALSLTDLILSLGAFAIGIPEGNPFLAWMGENGIFIPAKILLTAIAAGLIGYLYSRAKAQVLIHIAITVMLFVDIYHIYALNVILAAS